MILNGQSQPSFPWNFFLKPKASCP